MKAAVGGYTKVIRLEEEERMRRNRGGVTPMQQRRANKLPGKATWFLKKRKKEAVKSEKEKGKSMRKGKREGKKTRN